MINHLCLQKCFNLSKISFSRVPSRSHFFGLTTFFVLTTFIRQMVSKTQITFVLLTCAVLLLFIQPAVSQQDALRWGKRNSGLSDDYAPENARNWRRQQENKREYYGMPPSIMVTEHTLTWCSYYFDGQITTLLFICVTFLPKLQSLSFFLFFNLSIYGCNQPNGDNLSR